ncbi:MAG TPA: YHS domain-containing protein [Myxococcales bacterium]|nr:YHS domain-containing protein [Myxococcales bacterium]
MKTLLIAAALAVAPAYAHEMPEGHHQHAKEHADAPRSFDKQPPAGTWARCPVSGDVFQVNAGTEFAVYKGRVYAFCCDDCKPDFLKNPDKYADKK